MSVFLETARFLPMTIHHLLSVEVWVGQQISTEQPFAS